MEIKQIEILELFLVRSVLCSSIATQNLLKFWATLLVSFVRPSEDILAWANDVVGGNDEELLSQGPNKRDVLMIKGLIPLVYHVSGKVFELILRFSEVLGVVRIIQSVQHAFDYTFYLPRPFLDVESTMTDALEIRCLSGCELHGIRKSYQSLSTSMERFAGYGRAPRSSWDEGGASSSA